MPTCKTIERIHGEGEPSHAIIWLHGVGASAEEFVSVIPHLNLAASPTIRFVFPQAADRPVTINGGMVMPAWYDIKGPNIPDKEDLPALKESQAQINGLIEQQIASGIANENIILMGYSQGGAVTYYTALRSPYKLAGIIALSTYLLFERFMQQEQSGANLTTPILALHGSLDPVVPLAIGKYSVDVLKNQGYLVDWREYAIEHTVSIDELYDIGVWINHMFSLSNK